VGGVPFGGETSLIFHDHVAVNGAFIKTVLEHGFGADVLETTVWPFDAWQQATGDGVGHLFLGGVLESFVFDVFSFEFIVGS
jgi:hypothetical protein